MSRMSVNIIYGQISLDSCGSCGICIIISNSILFIVIANPDKRKNDGYYVVTLTFAPDAKVRVTLRANYVNICKFAI